MRAFLPVSLTLFVACGGSGGGSSPDASHPGDAGGGDHEAGPGRDAGAEAADGDAGAPPSADFFVSPAGEDAAGCGALVRPCKTIGYVQPLVTKLVATAPPRTVTVMLRGNAGPFTVAAPLSFGSADSGTQATPVLWSAYPGESPVVSGGVQVTSAWTAVSMSGGVVWSTTLPPATIDFEQIFIDGKRHTTPRAPTTSPSGYLFNVGPVCLAESDPTFSASACKMDTSMKGPPRCPASTPYECFDRFVFAAGDMSPSWSNITAGTTHPILIDDFEDWTVPKLRLASIAGNVAYLTGTTELDGQFHGFLPGHRYLVENVADALTSQAGAFYLDASTSPFTLRYFTKAGDDPNKEAVVYPQSPQLLVTGSPLSYVTFRGITFAHDDWLVPAQGYLSTQAEPTVTAAVSLVDASHVTIDACVFTNIQGHALEVIGSGKVTGTGMNTVTASAFYDLGGGGARIGMPASPQYTNDFETANNTFSENVIQGCGRVIPGSELLFVGNSNGNVVEHNDISDGYGDGISVCVPSGHDGCDEYGNRIAQNHVHHIKQGVTSDGGGIYVYSHNTAHASQPNVIENNWVHDVTGDPGPGGYGGNGLYLDNDSTNITVQNNLVYRASSQAMFVNFGYGHTLTNNIFAFGRKGLIGRGSNVVATGPLPAPAFVAKKNVFLWDENLSSAMLPDGGAPFAQSAAVWNCFGGSCTAEFTFADNLYWNVTPMTVPQFLVTPSSSLIAVPFSGAGSWQASYGEDEGSAYKNPLFKDPSCGKDDYSFSSTSAVSSVGFVPFDATTAGRTKPVLVVPPLAPGFPLQVPADPCSPVYY